MTTVVALFDRLREAKRALRDLIEHGVAKDRISLVSPVVGSGRRCTRLHLEDGPDRRMVLGFAVLTVPTVGPLLAAGPLLAGIAAAGAPVASDDLIERLREAGVPPADAERHALAIRQGGALVVVPAAEHEVDTVARILARHAPVDPVSRRRMPSTDAEEPPPP